MTTERDEIVRNADKLDNMFLQASVAAAERLLLLNQAEQRIIELEEALAICEGGTPPPVNEWGPRLKPPAGKILQGTSIPKGSTAEWQSITGFKPNIVHEYSTSGAGFEADLKSAAMKGCIPCINFKPRGKMGRAEYEAILAGAADVEINRAITAAHNYGKEFYFVPLHEPENDGGPEDDLLYRQAWEYIMDMVDRFGAKNMIKCQNFMGFDQHIPRYKNLYSPRAEIVMGDPYIHDISKTLARNGKPFYDEMTRLGCKRLIWAEWGIDKITVNQGGPQNGATQLLNQSALDAMQKAMPNLEGLVYWNQWKDQAQGDFKNYLLSNMPNTFGNFSHCSQFDVVVPPVYA